MDSGEVLQIGIVIGLLVLSALFSLAETAMADVSKIRIRGLAEAGDKQAQMLMKVFERHGKLINTILICDTAANLAAAILMTLLVTTHFGRQYVWAGAVPAAFLVLILGEIAPKTAAALYAEKLSLALAKPVYGLMVLFTPVLFLVEKLSNLVLLLFRINPKKKPEAITEEDLRTIVEVGHEEGVIESDEKKMIYNVFDFGDSVAKDIMVPRTDMACIDAEATYEEFMEVVREQMYTRYPVYEEMHPGLLKRTVLYIRIHEDGGFNGGASEDPEQYRHCAGRIWSDGRTDHAGGHAGGDRRRDPGRV